MGFKIKDMTNKSSSEDPAHIISSKERFLFFVEENRGLVWGVILLVVAGFIAIFTLNYLSQQQVEQAWEVQGEAQRIYLDRPLDNVAKGKANIQKSAEIFESLIAEYPGTTSAGVSSFLLANGMMEEKDYEGAIAIYTSLIGEFEQFPIILGLIHQRLGLAHLLNDNRDSALKAFNQVLSNTGALNKDQVLFEMAKLAESHEQTDQAVEHYKQLIRDYPLSPFSSEANLRLKVLVPEESLEMSEEASPVDSGEIEEEFKQEELEGQP